MVLFGKVLSAASMGQWVNFDLPNVKGGFIAPHDLALGDMVALETNTGQPLLIFTEDRGLVWRFIPALRIGTNVTPIRSEGVALRLIKESIGLRESAKDD